MLTSADLEVDLGGGVWLPLTIAPERDAQGRATAAPKTFSEAIRAAEEGSPFSEALAPLIRERWARGIGLDYALALGLWTRSSLVASTDDADDSPSYICPAGAATDVTLPAGNAGRIVAMEEHGGHLWVAQVGTTLVGGRVTQITGGTTVAAASPPNLALAAGRYVRGLISADNGSGTIRLYAMVSDGGVQNGSMYEWDGANWSAVPATFGTNGRGPAVTVTWRDRNNIAASRIVTISGPRTISYTVPNGDPMDPLDWVEGIKLGTAYQLRELVASRGHVYATADDGFWDLDEVGNSVNLLSDAASMIQPGTGYAGLVYDGWGFMSLGQGMVRISLTGEVNEGVGQCGPGFGTPMESALAGYVTAICPEPHGIFANVFNPTTRESFICWGKDAASLGINSPSPMIWHGPELFFIADHTVTRMRVSSLASGNPRLWVGSIDDQFATTPRLTWQYLPNGGSPAQDLASGGAWRCQSGATGLAGATVQPHARLISLRETWGDKASRKDLHATVYGTTGLGSGTKLTVFDRADVQRGSSSWGTGADVTVSPVETLTPSSVTSGYAIENRIDFFAPAAPVTPFLDSWRRTAWRVAPSFGVVELAVEYGDGVTVRGGGTWTHSKGVDWVSQQLQTLTTTARTTLRDPFGQRYTVRFHQVLDGPTTITGGPHKKRVTKRLRFTTIAGPL